MVEPKKKRKKRFPLMSEEIIVDYIFENQYCTKKDLYKALAHEYRDDIYVKKHMNPKTLRNRLKWLLEERHIISYYEYGQELFFLI